MAVEMLYQITTQLRNEAGDVILEATSKVHYPVKDSTATELELRMAYIKGLRGIESTMDDSIHGQAHIIEVET